MLILPVLDVARSQKLLNEMQKAVIRDAFTQDSQQRLVGQIVERANNLIPYSRTQTNRR